MILNLNLFASVFSNTLMIRQTKIGVGVLLLALSAALLPSALAAQAGDSSDVEARVKVAFVYNFTRFIEWPQSTLKQPVRIAVIGRGDLRHLWKKLRAAKWLTARPIEVIRLTSATLIPHCDVLLVEHSEAKHLSGLIQTVAGKPVLTVCDAANCMKDGAMIGFQLVEESVRFQINQDAAEKAGLKISSQLLKVALPSAGDH